MAQFGAAAAKNAPWARPPAGVAQQLVAQAPMAPPGLPNTSNAQLVLQQQQQLQQQQAVAYPQGIGMQQAGVGIPAAMATQNMAGPGVGMPNTMAPETVSYPTPRPMNNVTISAPPQVVRQEEKKQRVFTGNITKLHHNFGFVEEDVFFQTSCVKGPMPKVGDRVLVEATFNPNMPFKWNATRIQVLPSASGNNKSNYQSGQQFVGQNNPSFGNQAGSFGGQSYSAVPPPGKWDVGGGGGKWDVGPPGDTFLVPGVAPARRKSPPRRDRDRNRDRSRNRRSKEKKEKDDKEKDSKDGKDIRDRDIKKDRDREKRKRSRSPGTRSPPRRRQRATPRYMVQVPRIDITLKILNVLELRKRYANLYVPSDCFASRTLWQDAFPLHRPFTIEYPSSFHVFHKDVDAYAEAEASAEPPDVDYTWCAKVMLMAVPTMEEIFHRTCSLAEDPPDMRDSHVHPSRLISFLVGLKGKSETMAIGGPWSPSLDGKNPESDPNVLIKTAVRTCKALTGIDLTPCTKWYRFMDVHYRRSESIGPRRTTKVETTVIYLPDVWSCMPTRLEWDGLVFNYQKQMDDKLRLLRNDAQTDASHDEKDGKEEDGKEVLTPSHWAELDPKVMKVADLRTELEARLLNSKGLKSQLIARLTKALKGEEEEEKSEDGKASDAAKTKDEDKSVAALAATIKKEEERKEEEERLKKEQKEKDKKNEEEEKRLEKERSSLEKKYQMPESPHMVVHPNRAAKSGKFDCTVMSLSLLLDYRQEDNKEHSFEVSLFAELFNEMLMRDHSFRIFRSLVEAPERQKDDEKDKKDKERKDKDDKKDSDKEDKKDSKEKSEDKDDDDKEEKSEKKEKKLMTMERELLLSFIYFDSTQCGYIFEKDLEEILLFLGISLSRAQIRKLVQKVTSRDAFNYRKLTDKEEDSQETVDVKKELFTQEELAESNLNLLKEQKKIKTEEGTTENSLIMYNGSLLDVEKLFTKIRKSEEARTETEKRMEVLQKERNESKASETVAVQKAEKLAQELDVCNRTLAATQQSYALFKDRAFEFQSVVKTIHSALSPLAKTNPELQIKEEKISVGTDDSMDIEESKANGDA